MRGLAKAMREVFVYDGAYSQYRRRHHGRPVEGLSAHHFLAFVQNHDQVGNRAQGERIEQLIGMDRAKVAAGLMLTAPFVPLLFMGEEFAASTPFLYFANHEEPEVARLVLEGRAREFAAFGFSEKDVPDPEAPETFARSKLNWAEAEDGRHKEMLAWYRSLIQLRRRLSAAERRRPGAPPDPLRRGRPLPGHPPSRPRPPATYACWPIWGDARCASMWTTIIEWSWHRAPESLAKRVSWSCQRIHSWS